MDSLLPGKKRFIEHNAHGEIVKKWVSKELNWKAKVVCAECNNTWMSDIEHSHAKPALADLIIGKLGVPVDPARARSIATFSFKTAAVFDLISAYHPPFFRKDERYAFRSSLAIPSTAKMWIAAFAPVGKGRVHTGYFQGTTSPANLFRGYVCTFGVEHFVFQLIAVRTSQRLRPAPGFEHLAVPLWPRFRSFVWPIPWVLNTSQHFEAFSLRWKTVSIVT